jgi:hypothetical protein
VAQVLIDAAVVQGLLARRDELVRTITASMASQDWQPVMPAFDALLAALQQLEASVEANRGSAAQPPKRREHSDLDPEAA